MQRLTFPKLLLACLGFVADAAAQEPGLPPPPAPRAPLAQPAPNAQPAHTARPAPLAQTAPTAQPAHTAQPAPTAPFAQRASLAQTAEIAEFAREAGELLARNYSAEGPGAAVLVARGDSVLFRAARGEADIDAHVPLAPDALFRIGSVTKQFAAAGLLTLVDAGKVALEDPLSKYLPDFPGGEHITVLQLLNHTSGVKSYTSIPGYVETSIRRDLSTAELVDVFDHEAPDFAPGTSWAYSNSGYVLVGAVIEAASGKPWHEYLDEALFRPLGMEHTGYGHDPAIADRQVQGYSRDGDRVVPMLPMSMTQPHAAGALVSNVDDLLTWNRALHEGRVLEDATYRQMITPVGEAASAGILYGFGLFEGFLRSCDTLEHGGAIFGFASSLMYLPGPDITVVVLENDDADNAGDPGDILARRLAAMALGDPYPALRAVPVEPGTLEAAQAVYRFDAETTRVLRVVDGALTAQRGSGPRRQLTPIAVDEFLYEDGFNRLRLERDAAGAISAMRFFANGDGDGVVGARTDEPLPIEPVALRLPRAALERLVGEYVNGGLKLTIFLDGEDLKGQLPGQDPVNLRATSLVRFDVAEADAAVEFSPGEAPAAEAIMKQSGRELVLQRVP